MKERIKELAVQARKEFLELPTGYRPEQVGMYPQLMEKFAELIVGECISKCEFVANMATITNTGEMARKTKATADSCATMIKEHFGVEE